MSAPIKKPVDARPFTLTVMLYPFVYLNENNEPDRKGLTPEHCPIEENPHGWNVWIRRDYVDAKPNTFDALTGYDFDFDDEDTPIDDLYEEARGKAQQLASEFQCEIEEY